MPDHLHPMAEILERSVSNSNDCALICSIGKWDRFVYTLYHLRARVSAEAAVVAGAEGSSETYMSSLLPVT